MIVASASSAASTGASSSNAMSPAALGSIIIGSAIFLLLIGQVAYASYKRRKEHDWNVAEWRRAESELRTVSQEQQANKEILH